MATRKTPDDLEHEKQRAALAAARWVTDGLRLGLGSGSTAAYFIRRVGQRVREEGLRIVGVPTSLASQRLAREMDIPLLEPARGLRLDLTVDGADEISPSLTLIKGGGGALLREKVIATASRRLLIIGDSSKLVATLGRIPLPLEVIPFAAPLIMDRIEELGGVPVLRPDQDAPGENARTDQGNWLLDCRFEQISDPPALSQVLRSIPGVVEHGLFIDLAEAAIIADGETALLLRPGKEPEPIEHFSSPP